MRVLRLAAIIFFSLLMLSCSGISQRQAFTWLDSKSEPPEFNVSGSWESVNSMFNGGWGNANFAQSGSQVTGTLGLYNVEGKVAGKKLFLMILSGRRIYYTAVVEPTKKDELSGMAFSKVLADDPESRYADRAPIQLVRPR